MGHNENVVSMGCLSMSSSQPSRHVLKAVRGPLARSGQYLHGWAESLQIVSEPILNPNVGICSIGP